MISELLVIKNSFLTILFFVVHLISSKSDEIKYREHLKILYNCWSEATLLGGSRGAESPRKGIIRVILSDLDEI